MTVLLLDSFNRTASDLSASPSGRWGIPAAGGGLTNAWSVDGQTARTATTATGSTTLYAFFYGTNPGTARGKWSVKATRATANVAAIGVCARTSTGSALLYERYWFGVTNETGTERFELRLYTAYSTYILVASVNLSSFSLSMDTAQHTYAVTIASNESLIDITCAYDGLNVIAMMNQTDFLTVLGTYRGVGIQATSGATWSTSDYATFDNASFDDLSTPSTQAAFALVSEPTLTPITVTLETDDVTGSTLPINPDRGEVLEEVFPVVEHRSEAGYDTTFARATKSRKRYSVAWSNLSASDFASLRDFLVDTAAIDGFTYTDAIGDAVTVRFVEGSLRWSRVAPDVYTDISATFEEIG